MEEDAPKSAQKPETIQRVSISLSGSKVVQ